MFVKTVVVGELSTNCYLLSKEEKILVIDPGAEEDKIIEEIGDREVVGIIITHYHFDHIGALERLKEKYHVLVYDYSTMNEGTFSIDSFTFEVIFTPGHKEDAITLYFPKERMMFVGDFIFYHSIGRMDLPGGSQEDMHRSIERILSFDEEIILYPGHGLKTSLKKEKENLNYYLSII